MANEFPEATGRPWKLREGTSIVCADDQRSDVAIIVGQVNAGTLKTRRAQQNAALILTAVNRYDTFIRELSFAVANGHKWTLGDWQNWLMNHAEPALHPQPEEEGK